jgi:tRNA-modifying protein YgfZ
MSAQHGSPEFPRQYEALTQGVGCAELPGRTIIAVTGADRAQFLQSFTTNDIKKLVPSAGCEAFVTSSQGKTLGHVLIFCEANQYSLDTTQGQAAALISHFERYVITEDVQFSDRSDERADLLVAGPNAAKVLAQLIDSNPPTKLLAHVPATIAGRSVILRRVEYTVPRSYFAQTAASDAQEVAAAICRAGAVRCQSEAVEAVRLEGGVPVFGIDITPDNLPQEVARDAQAISFTKGCYLGQETVARIDAIGHVNRLLVGLKFSGKQIPPAATALLAGDQAIGHVTSAVWSPRLDAPLALAYIRRTHAKKGSLLSSSYGAAEVLDLPLVAREP